MPCEVPVNLGDRSYKIHIQWGSLSEAPTLLGRHASAEPSHSGLGKHLFLVTHPGVQSLYGEGLQKVLSREGYAVDTSTVPEGESSKCLEVASRLYDRMVEAGVKRDSVVVALGGGVVGDLAGFVAATYMRGIRFVQIPTTLLSQVDASVGGKVALNHPSAKNLIGAFHQPSFVLIDPETLTTLPDREIRAGMAEVVKYGMIHDESFLAYIEDNLDDLLALSPDPIETILRRSCEIKAWVVERDERESDLRALLNFGHTIGHAVEAVMGYGEMLHGECVAVGMLAATHMATECGLCPPEVGDRLRRLLIRIGLPVTVPSQHTDGILAAMKLDKKGRAGKMRFVLPEGIGSVNLVEVTEEALVAHALDSIMNEASGNG
ncbi:MAG: 3-dehydroquinate synthase [Armatimonadetes bacterium]|nr:3-dehydroquinate synthase [Armatimonadota bacterium]